MLVAFVYQPFINLIAEAERVILDAQVSNHLQLLSGENLFGKGKRRDVRYANAILKKKKNDIGKDYFIEASYSRGAIAEGNNMVFMSTEDCLPLQKFRKGINILIC